jgi:hypothetical protein
MEEKARKEKWGRKKKRQRRVQVEELMTGDYLRGHWVTSQCLQEKGKLVQV